MRRTVGPRRRRARRRALPRRGDTPHLAALARDGRHAAAPRRSLPAVTCSVQSTSHRAPAARARHRRQRLVLPRPRRGAALAAVEPAGRRARRSGRRRRRRDPAFTCAKLFWWYNMYASADCRSRRARCTPPTAARSPTSTPSPAELRDELQAELGAFPLFEFWGPRAGHRSTRGSPTRAPRLRHAAADATLVYLPHLDYNLQRLGPDAPARSREDLRAVDAVVRRADRARARATGARVVVLSEYGITAVTRRRPHQPRAARGRAARGARRARARDARRRRLRGVRGGRPPGGPRLRAATGARRRGQARCCERLPGVERVLDEDGKRAAGLDHPRSGELVAVARARSLVHLLLLARRRPRARLRAHRRHPPQARLRPGRSCSSIRRSALPKLKVGWRARARRSSASAT